ncbi:MAG TPA: substrate-binding domain-containing protein [Anaerolineaceae bacterium]
MTDDKHVVAGGQAGGQKRPLFALFCANIHIGSARQLWLGAIDAARELDVNLVCFPGGELRAARGYEAERNSIYSLVSSRRVDGLIFWSSTLGVNLSAAELDVFLRQYQPLPAVNLARLVAWLPTILMDSYLGMRMVVNHLIEAHGCRKVAFIRGPETHTYAQERFAAYQAALKARGIPYDPALVTPPLPWGAGAEAIRLLLESRGLRPGEDIDAIASVSDLTALSALGALQSRGIKVPEELALVGFNDQFESRTSIPPLTTVAQPLYDQGWTAVETLLARWRGESIPAQVRLETRLVLRQSCGCPARSILLASAADHLPAFVESPGFQAAGDMPAAEVEDAFWEAIEGGSDQFIPRLERLLGEEMESNRDLTGWQDGVSRLRRTALTRLDPVARRHAEDLIGQARVLIHETSLRNQARQQWQAERQAQAVRELTLALITAFDLERLAEVLASRLPEIGITTCFLALFENPSVSFETARLVYAHSSQGRASLPPEGLLFQARELVPEGFFPQHRISLVLEPLFFEHEQIGFALFEVGPHDGSIYEDLRGAVSSALKGALLFREVQKARETAEKADRIKTRLLANVSHELRTPLNIILENTRTARQQPGHAPDHALNQIERSAEHQLRVINDLLDLSRAEIDELDIYLELLDPKPLLEEVFHSLADPLPPDSPVRWRLELPERLPVVRVDPVRLRQVLLNLLSNAARFTRAGQIVLGAEAAPPQLHLWVADTGAGIPLEEQERIFEPFVTVERDGSLAGGIGLGLSITRRLVRLHSGWMHLESQPGVGSTFHVYLPLPSLASQETGGSSQPAGQKVRALVYISHRGIVPPDIQAFCQRQNLPLRLLSASDSLDAALEDREAAAVAWDMSEADPLEWALIRRVQNHPRLSHAPFLLYGSPAATGFLVKPVNPQRLADIIHATAMLKMAGPVLLVDDDPRTCATYRAMIEQSFPGLPVEVAYDGSAALELAEKQAPRLVILDLNMPGMDGFETLDRLRASSTAQRTPVIILSSRKLSQADLKRLEQHSRVTFQTKGVLTNEELAAALHRSLFGSEALPQQTSLLVKRAVAYLQQNYTRSLARWEIASAVGASEDYLTRAFRQELGISPWEYLNRYRVEHARRLLRGSAESMNSIARQVGFKDPLYFSRVFHKITGVSPTEFREKAEG